MNDDDTLKLNTCGTVFIGRDTERSLLEKIYKEGRSCGQVVWISGDSGVGKSALIQNFLHDKKYVCSGKFEFIKSSVPYSVVTKVLHELCSFLEVEHLKLRISPEVISILTKLLPQIRHVTTRLEMDDGLDRIAEGNSGEWGFQKLKQAARAFIEAAIEAISSASRLPVIFHFDDLQWADEASLEIIKALWNGSDVIQDLICLSSFRGNEISDDSPFYRFREFFENSQYICTEISIGNLAFGDVINVVAKLLNITRVQSEHLGRLVFDVTRGNALFIRRFLHFVLEGKHIRRCINHHDLEIDEANILVEFEGCEGIVNFLMQEISSLPYSTSAVLKVASLLGQQIHVALLESILENIELDFQDYSFTAAIECLESKRFIEIQSDKKTFIFLHDRIQQAAYNLLTEHHDVELLSLQIGRLMLEEEDCTQDSKSNFKFLMAVNQINRGRALLDSMESRMELANYNVEAAKEVLRLSAFNLARNYLEISLEILGENCWENHYSLTLTINSLLASVLSASGLMNEALHLIANISDNCKRVEDRYDTQILRLEILACINDLDKCFVVSKALLSDLRVPSVSLNPSTTSIFAAIFKLKRSFSALSHEDVLALPRCEDKRIQHAMKIFNILCPVAYLSSKESMVPILACRMVELTLKFGLTNVSPYALSSYGFCLTLLQDFNEAFRIGSLALQMMEHFGEDARTLVSYYTFISHTKKHIVDAFEPSLKAYYISFLQGDLAFSGQAITIHLTARMIAGVSLEHIINDTFCFANQLKAYNQTMMWNTLLIFQRTNLELADRSDEMDKMLGKEPTDDDFQSYLQDTNQEFHNFTFFSFTLRCRCILDDKESALLLAKKCWRSKKLLAPLIGSQFYYFYSALMALELWKRARPIARFQFWRILRRFQRILTSWTKMGNPNTIHLVLLLKAQVLTATAPEKSEAIMTLFHQSITKSRRLGFLHDAALGNELLGKYCVCMCDYDLARSYLERAKALYFDWGAFKKVKQMESQYGNLVGNEVTIELLSTAIKGRSRQELVTEIEAVRSRTGL